MSYAREKLGAKRVLAVVSPDNQNSIRLLGKMGFHYERMVRLSDDAQEIKLFSAAV